MKQRHMGEDIRRALDAELSGLTVTPSRQQRIFENATGGQKMKRKISVGLILALALALLSLGALAAALLSAQQVVEEKAVPLAQNNDSDWRVNTKFSPEELAEFIRACGENGIDLDENDQIMQALREGEGYDEEEAIMVKGLEALDRIGVKPVGYRSPGFDFSPNTVEILEKYGIKYDSSLMGNDYYPYCPAPCTIHFDRANEFGEPAKLVEMPASWFLDDFPHSEFIMTRTGMKPQSQIFEIWKTHFDYGIAHTQNGMMAVCTHPQVIGRPHNITMLEEFINYILERGACIMPLKDIYERVSF